MLANRLARTICLFSGAERVRHKRLRPANPPRSRFLFFTAELRPIARPFARDQRRPRLSAETGGVAIAAPITSSRSCSPRVDLQHHDDGPFATASWPPLSRRPSGRHRIIVVSSRLVSGSARRRRGVGAAKVRGRPTPRPPPRSPLRRVPALGAAGVPQRGRGSSPRRTRTRLPLSPARAAARPGTRGSR